MSEREGGREEGGREREKRERGEKARERERARERRELINYICTYQTNIISKIGECIILHAITCKHKMCNEVGNHSWIVRHFHRCVLPFMHTSHGHTIIRMWMREHNSLTLQHTYMYMYVHVSSS